MYIYITKYSICMALQPLYRRTVLTAHAASTTTWAEYSQ